MANIDFSLLDVPRSVPVEDPEAYLHAAIAWHFGEDTGSAFWLRTNGCFAQRLPVCAVPWPSNASRPSPSL